MIASGEFKPNCAIVILDFLIRHGIIQPDDGELSLLEQSCDKPFYQYGRLCNKMYHILCSFFIT